MTVAAVEAELLDSLVAARLTRAAAGGGGVTPSALAGLGREHARAATGVIEEAW